MNLDIFANIKITNDVRLKYALVSIQSLLFLKDEVKFYFNLDNCSKYLSKIEEALQSFNYELINDHKPYSEVYLNFIEKSEKDFFMHFEEDHFCVLDQLKILEHILNINEVKFQIIKLTFFMLEKEFYKDAPTIYEDDFCKIIDNTHDNHIAFNKKKHRFYLGNNSIFEKQFGKKYFDRFKHQYKPHFFEIDKYNEKFLHNFALPKKEILCSIDDDHGKKDSSLLNRNELKWKEIYGKLK